MRTIPLLTGSARTEAEKTLRKLFVQAAKSKTNAVLTRSYDSPVTHDIFAKHKRAEGGRFELADCLVEITDSDDLGDEIQFTLHVHEIG